MKPNQNCWTTSTKFTKPLNPKLLEKPPEFLSIVRSSSRILLLVSQFMGYCPHTLGPGHQLRFRWLSVPVLIIVINFIGLTLWGAYYSWKKADYDIIFGLGEGADGFGTKLVMVVTYHGQNALRISGLISRTRVQNLWERLHVVLNEIYEAGTVESQTSLVKEVQGHSRNLKVLFAVVQAAVLISTVSLGFTVLEKARRVYSTSGSLVLLFCIVFWDSQAILHITKTLWFVHMIELMAMGFAHVGPCPMNQALYPKHYRAMEELVSSFNRVYAFELTLTVISVGIVILNSAYNTCVKSMDGISFNAFYSLPSYINCFAIFFICSSATRMTKEAQTSAVSLRERLSRAPHIDAEQWDEIDFIAAKAIGLPPVISPGHCFDINKKLLTSMLGSIVTYSIVLLQFRGGENGRGIK